MEINPEIETSANIKVVGVGGGGGSTLNQMVSSGLKGVDFIAVNTDIQALQHSLASIKIHVGKTITRGLGAGMDPDMGRKAAEENQNEIREALKGADMVFITSGLGGGTGSGASPVIANIAKELGALTIAVTTKPFSFEGTQRKMIADKAHENIVGKVDAIITIPNDRILQIIDKKTSLLDAFSIVDDVLRQGVQGISEVITIHGLTNVDFADVRFIMKDSGTALMGIGVGKGENRAVDAAMAAVESPLLETSISGATGVLFTVTGGRDLGMFELTEAAKVITEQVSPDARIIYGTSIDENLTDELKITVVATGFDKVSQSSKGNNRSQDRGGQSFPAPSYGARNDGRMGVSSSSYSSSSTPSSNPTPSSGDNYGFSSRPVEPPPVKEATPIPEPPSIPKPPVPQHPSSNNSGNSDLDIPAFIRKKMS